MVARQTINAVQDGYAPGPTELCAHNDITALFRVASRTVWYWRPGSGGRDLLPPADDVLDGGRTPVWFVRTLITWAAQTGRAVYLQPDAAQRYGQRAA